MTSKSCDLHEGTAGDEPLHGPMREADTQFDWNEKFPRSRGAVGRFVKFWTKTARTSQ